MRKYKQCIVVLWLAALFLLAWDLVPNGPMMVPSYDRDLSLKKGFHRADTLHV